MAKEVQTNTETLKQTLFDLISQCQKQYQRSVIETALTFAEAAHKGQMRKTNEPYINHPLRTAITIAELKMDTQTITASLLHDTIEDCDIPPKIIEEKFGNEVCELVKGVTNLGKIKYRVPRENTEKKQITENAENIRNMFLAIAQDVRVAIIKLADRLDNVLTIEGIRHEKQYRYAAETLEVHAPLAHRLGIHTIAAGLEDATFPYVYPKEYQWVKTLFETNAQKLTIYIQKVVEKLKSILKEKNMSDVTVEYRIKHLYSLWQKLERVDRDITRIHDIAAMRIVTQSIEECYQILGIIHSLWKPVPERFRDYIALPKPNGYQAIHTDVFCDDNRIVEIQIKTQEMHEQAEHGIAAHWFYSSIRTRKPTQHYKKRTAIKTPELPKELTWINQLQEWQHYFHNPEEFVESLKIDYFKDRVFVLTPKGKVIDLPRGATAVDFAYHIHTTLGNECSGVKINGKNCPLNQELQSMNIVEILTQKGKKPSLQWLEFVKTAIAKEKIKHELKQNIRKLEKR